MKQQHNVDRKNRTRTLIMLGGLLQKSGLMDAFHITPGDELQAYENRPKALQLLGFLITCFEENEFDEDNFERWRSVGERRF
ncbi:MAG: conjugal transfer protein TraD [Alphaproteobacteria bacterium]|nr:conjugal transfer protein TraD [Alphaproteobacteria bacterium]